MVCIKVKECIFVCKGVELICSTAEKFQELRGFHGL